MADPEDLWAQMSEVLTEDMGFVLATVISTSSSAPLPAGTQMAILDDGRVIGSVSGGCVESDVYARAEIVRETGEPHLQTYGYSDESAFSVGLVCGGSIEVYLERAEGEDLDFFRELAGRIKNGDSVAVLTAVAGPDIGLREIIGDDVAVGAGAICQTDDETSQIANQMLLQHRSDSFSVTEGETETRYFVRSFATRAQMIVFGSNSFAVALVRIGKLTGYHVTVCDARATFATRERFPDADELVVKWPHKYLDEVTVNQRTVICVLTHDSKFDDPLLQRALRSDAGFIGAMGSRRTTDERYERLRASGLTDAELGRLHAPFGLDLGAKTAEETAVSMMAEVISDRENGTNLPLGQARGPIHGTRDSGTGAVQKS